MNPGSGVSSHDTQRVITKPSIKTAVDDPEPPISIDQAESARRARSILSPAEPEHVDEAS